MQRSDDLKSIVVSNNDVNDLINYLMEIVIFTKSEGHESKIHIDAMSDLFLSI